MKAIITDLDRTLLRSDKSLSPRTVEVLSRCREQGLYIMAASARPLRGILPFCELIPFDAIAASNGALIHLPTQQLEHVIAHDSAEKILASLMQFDDVFLSIQTRDKLYSNRDIPEWKPVIYHDFPRIPPQAQLYKILASSTDRRLYQNIESALTPDTYHTVAGENLIQIMSTEATKWHGIQQMLQHFGLSPADAVYFGDDNDDLEPIRRCGLGVAVENAIPAVLHAAAHIAPSNEMDGVACFLEKHYLA